VLFPLLALFGVALAVVLAIVVIRRVGRRRRTTGALSPAGPGA